jgi:hypothetical protein
MLIRPFPSDMPKLAIAVAAKHRRTRMRAIHASPSPEVVAGQKICFYCYRGGPTWPGMAAGSRGPWISIGVAT